LIFMAELVFAAGYAWEKFAKPRVVGALPVT
jgi:hypothetical protein